MSYENEKKHNYRQRQLKSNKNCDKMTSHSLKLSVIHGSHLKMLICTLYECQLDLYLLILVQKGTNNYLTYRKTCKIFEKIYANFYESLY